MPENVTQPDLPVASRRYSLNLRRMWQLTALLMIIVSVAPLTVMTAIDYRVTEKSAESEILLHTSQVVSNTKLAVEFSLVERMAALDFIVEDNSFAELHDCARVGQILENLQTSFAGFVDLGVIDSSGRQFCYVGPYDLAGVNYSDQAWFEDVKQVATHISDVFPGFRHVPHMVIAVRHDLPDGGFYVLRTSVETSLLASSCQTSRSAVRATRSSSIVRAFFRRRRGGTATCSRPSIWRCPSTRRRHGCTRPSRRMVRRSSSDTPTFRTLRSSS